MSKYKLINKTTGTETLCDKVTIDGFDYYVSDEKPKRKDGCITFTNAVYQNTQKSLNNKLVFLDKEIVNLHEILCRVEFEDVSVELPFDVSELKKVIATNNPNIDVPKVVDEVYINKEKNQELIDLINYTLPNEQLTLNQQSIIYHHNKSQQTHPFSEEDMIEFGEWCENLQKDNKEIRRSNPSITTKELLQIWEEQRPKIVYYE